MDQDLESARQSDIAAAFQHMQQHLVEHLAPAPKPGNFTTGIIQQITSGAEFTHQYVIDDPANKSWIIYLPNPIGLATSATDELFMHMCHMDNDISWERMTTGNGRALPRETAWFTAGDCSCQYKYGNTVSCATCYPESLKRVQEQIQALLGIPTLNSCQANRYANGEEYCGVHADNEDLFKDDVSESTIVSLSLGASRDFVVKSNSNPSDSADIRVMLNPGDIVIMVGRVQHHYKHSAPKSPSTLLPRINLTFRTLFNHDEECKLRA